MNKKWKAKLSMMSNSLEIDLNEQVNYYEHVQLDAYVYDLIKYICSMNEQITSDLERQKIE